MSKIAVFDIETSHPQRRHARVIEIAYEILDPATLDTVRRCSCLVRHRDDDVLIDEASSHVHGITSEQCEAEGRDIVEVLHDMVSDWADVGTLVSHGLDVDLDILALEFIRVLSYWPFSHCELVCTKEIGAYVCCIPRGRDGYKWPTMIELFHTLFPDEKGVTASHRAADDVVMCVRCYRAIS